MTISNDIPLTLVLLIIFFGAFVRATFGFGDALIAMPLLALVVSIQIASPLVAFLSIIIGTTMLILNWGKVDFKAAWRLILSSALGIPVGLYFLKTVPEEYIKILLGIILILFGAYNLFRPKLPTIQSNLWAYVMGFLGGILGGAYNANGPPVIIYGRLARWEPDRFRATLQSYFMPTAAFIFIGHGLSGSWTSEVLTLFAYSFPVILVAIVLGTLLSKRIPDGMFDRLVYLAIIGMGILMFL
ncbi:MAG: sulfite exporter TauE/SafE family protein [Chloroflexi bacterium]|nr:sulfite exporter TauE/SafE family protein [Chloroflexota bacterium]